MMAVDDVIAVADPVDVDRRQLPAFDHRGVHPRPPIAQTSCGRQETRKEIACLGGRRCGADDLVDPNLADPAERPALRAGGGPHGVERYEPGRAPGQGVPDRPPEGAEARGIEVFTGAYLFPTRRL